MAAAVTFINNPLLLALIAFGLIATVSTRRTEEGSWARALRGYLILAVVILAVRLVLQIVFGAQRRGTVLFTLPSVPLPSWAAGIRLGGPVTAEALLSSGFDALRLAVMLLAVGCATLLANPRRALRSVPSMLDDISVAVVIALTAVPQLLDSISRVRRARRLRGGRGSGVRALDSLIIPVLHDAVDSSLSLAAGMEARGHGRLRATGARRRRVSVALLAALMVLTFGVFALMGGVGGWTVPLACFALGVALVALAVRLDGRRRRPTRYRPEPWRTTDSIVLGSGLAMIVGAVTFRALLPAAVLTPTDPPTWPDLTLAALSLLGCLVAPLAVTSPFARELGTEPVLGGRMTA